MAITDEQRCTATTQRGTRCAKRRTEGCTHCYLHDPNRPPSSRRTSTIQLKEELDALREIVYKQAAQLEEQRNYINVILT
ncbi:MAG: hypothetical protein ACYCUI_16190, partial [Vulcanimicrobiaceae bacterium]